MKYAIIIPAKNEEQDLPGTLDSIVKQTILPVIALVLDDHSTDATAEIVHVYSRRYPFVHYLYHSGESDYSLGAKVVHLFHKGVEYIHSLNLPIEYITKMDADVTFPPDLYEKIHSYIIQHPAKYGILSCIPRLKMNGKVKEMVSPEWHTNGQLKIYHQECLRDMGGLIPDLGWDCADNLSAKEKGWETRVIPHLHYNLTRPIGRFSLKKGAIRQGKGAYKLRHSIPYIMLKAMHDAFKPPFLTHGIFYLKGYLQALLRNQPRTISRKQGKMLRKLLWKSFFSRLKNRQFVLLQRKGSIEQ